MEQFSEQWQNLHTRVVCGEALNDDDRQYYEKEMARFDASETYPSTLEQTRKLRVVVREAEEEQRCLLEYAAVLKARIREMEMCLDTKTQERLGIGVS